MDSADRLGSIWREPNVVFLFFAKRQKRFGGNAK